MNVAGETMNDEEIAEWFGMSKGYFSKGYNWYRKLKGNQTGNPASEPHIPISKFPNLKLRLHRYQRSYKILNAVSEDKLRSLKLNRLNNTNQWLGAGFRVTSQHLEIEGMGLISDSRLNVAILEAQAQTLADNAAQRLASLYGLVISKEGQTPPKLTEIELNATEITKKMEHKGLIELYSDPEGYKIWVDWSFGIGGLESNKDTYMQKLTDFANDLVVNDSWEKTKANAQIAASFATNIELHLEVEKKQLVNQENLALMLQEVREYLKPRPSLWQKIKRLFE